VNPAPIETDALVIGAGDATGGAIARRFAREGYAAVIVRRDAENLKALTDQIRALRKTLAADFGFVMPPVRILDNMRLPTQGYAIRIKEMEAGAARFAWAC